MKRGTTPTLQVKLDYNDFQNLSRVDFLLKQHCEEECETKVLKTFPSSSVTLNQTTGVFSIQYTEQETRTFEHDKNIYLDVRPVLTDGQILATGIVKLFVDATLFSQTEISDD